MTFFTICDKEELASDEKLSLVFASSISFHERDSLSLENRTFRASGCVIYAAHEALSKLGVNQIAETKFTSSKAKKTKKEKVKLHLPYNSFQFPRNLPAKISPSRFLPSKPFNIPRS